MKNSDVLIAAIAALVGALFGGLSRSIVERYNEFKEGQRLAGALRAEIDALLGLVKTRNYLKSLEDIIQRLEFASDVTPNDFFTPPIAREYFPVFKSIVPKIGILREAGAPTVKAYMLAQSAIEDIHALGQRRVRFEGGLERPQKDEILTMTRQLKFVLDEALSLGAEAILSLDHLLSRRWLGIVP